MTVGAPDAVAAPAAGAVVVAGAVDVADPPDAAGAVVVEDDEEPLPVTARTACWQDDERLATFFSRHCNAADPPVGTLAQ